MVEKNKITYNTVIYYANLNQLKNNEIIRDENSFKKRKAKRLAREILNNGFNCSTRTSRYATRSPLIYAGVIGDFFVGQYNNCKNTYKKLHKKVNRSFSSRA